MTLARRLAAIWMLGFLLVSSLALSKGGPEPLGVLVLAVPLLASLLLPRRGISGVWHGFLLGTMFYGIQTITAGLTGGAGASGVSYEPETVLWTSLWAALTGLTSAIIAWLLAGDRRDSPLYPVILGLTVTMTSVSLRGLAFSTAPTSMILLGVTPILIAGVAAGVASVRWGFWAGASMLAMSRVLIVMSPIVGGLTPLPRIVGSLVALVSVSLVVGGGELLRAVRSGVLGKTVLAASGLVLAGLLVMGLIGARMVVVVSGSMEPSLSVGDIAVVVPSTNISVGDVILYRHDGELVIHRVVSIGPSGIETKGDANSGPDPWTVRRGDVVGVMAFHIPWLGKPLLWARGLPQR